MKEDAREPGASRIQLGALLLGLLASGFLTAVLVSEQGPTDFSRKQYSPPYEEPMRAWWTKVQVLTVALLVLCPLAVMEIQSHVEKRLGPRPLLFALGVLPQAVIWFWAGFIAYVSLLHKSGSVPENAVTHTAVVFLMSLSIYCVAAAVYVFRKKPASS